MSMISNSRQLPRFGDEFPGAPPNVPMDPKTAQALQDALNSLVLAENLEKPSVDTFEKHSK